MRRAAIAFVLALTQVSCTIVGAVIGGVTAQRHNDSVHVSRPPPAPMVESPLCLEHRRALEAAALRETDENRRTLALRELPDCRVPPPATTAPVETPDDQSGTSSVLAGLFVGATVDVVLLLLVVIPAANAGNGDGPPVR